jgi:hypothetical protein
MKVYTVVDIHDYSLDLMVLDYNLVADMMAEVAAADIVDIVVAVVVVVVDNLLSYY